MQVKKAIASSAHVFNIGRPAARKAGLSRANVRYAVSGDEVSRK
jgi:hypothetical protein